MWVILLLFALVSVINGKLQITTTSSSVTIRHFVDDNQKYIQLLTNDDESLQLNCRSDDDSSTFIQWHLPNNSFFADYSHPQVDGRMQIDGNQLTIEELRIGDTGVYRCTSSGNTIEDEDTIYVFVNDGRHHLLPWKPDSSLTFDDERPAPIPCRVTRFDVDVSISINTKPRDDFRTVYDPRVGFKVSAEQLQKVDGLSHGRNALCKATVVGFQTTMPSVQSSNVTFKLFLIERRKTPLKPTIRLVTELPYVGQSLSLYCTVPIGTQQHYLFGFNWTCPACTSSPERIQISTNEKIAGGVRSNLTIISAQLTDTGTYSCTAFELGGNKSVSTGHIDQYVDVSRTRGRLTIDEKSSDRMIVVVGDSINLMMRFKARPHDYEKKWIKRMTSPLHGDIEMTIDDDGDRIRLATDGTIDGVFSEYLTISSAQLNDTANYSLELTIGGDLFHFETFHVDVQSKSVDSKIIIFPLSNRDQPISSRYLKYGERYEIVCSILANPLPTSGQLMMKQCARCTDEWQQVDVETAIGSTELALIWRMSAEFVTTVRCTSQRDGQEYSTVDKELIVSDLIDDNIDIFIEHQSPSDVQSDTYDQIYTGDRVTVGCKVNKYDVESVQMTRSSSEDDDNEETLNDRIESRNESFSTIYRLQIDDVHSGHTGVYRCRVKFATLSESIVRHQFLNVTSVKSPTLIDRSPAIVNATYSTSVSLYCKMTGVPKPTIVWWKDEKELELPQYGIELLDDGQNLTFARVVQTDDATYVCRLSNRGGRLDHYMQLKVIDAPDLPIMERTTMAIVIGACLVLLSIIVCLCVLVFKQRRRQAMQAKMLCDLYSQLMDNTTTVDKLNDKLDPNVPLADQVDDLPYDRRFELNKENLNLHVVLGEGQFGKVFRGTLVSDSIVSDQVCARKSIPVAVKVPRNGRSVQHQKALLDELKIMIAIGDHVNVLCLIGAITKRMAKAELFVVTELCHHGSLLHFLRENRAAFLNEIVSDGGDRLSSTAPMSSDGYLSPQKTKPIRAVTAESDPNWAEQADKSRQCGEMQTTADLLSFGYQIANGMEHLAKKTMIHRDLATRNLLLTEQRIVKIADFGLARQDEHYHIEKSKYVPLPVKWMALESIIDQNFTTQSDVWSFGVVLWELFSLGETPYADQHFHNLVQFLKSGNRLEQPANSPVEIYNLMRQCWLLDVDQRPTFSECRAQLSEQLQRAAKPFFDRLQLQLRHTECDRIAQFHTWRTDAIDKVRYGVDDDDDAEAQQRLTAASSNGFMRVPTHDPDDIRPSSRRSGAVPVENPIYMGATSSSSKMMTDT